MSVLGVLFKRRCFFTTNVTRVGINFGRANNVMFFAVENLKRLLVDCEFLVLKRNRCSGSKENRCSDGADKMFRFYRSTCGGQDLLDTTCRETCQGKSKSYKEYVMR